MRKFGFKIFSSNLYNAPMLIEDFAKFVATKDDMFVELMVVPDSSMDDFLKIKQILGNIEVRLHAPHESFGFNPGDKESESHNKKLFELTQKVADIFASKTIVVHTGYENGKKYLDEAIRQIKLFNDKRIVVENLPYFDNNGKTMVSCSAKDIAYIMRECGCGFCFDFSHAVCAALSLNTDIETQLQSFYALKPAVYHMCDGNINEPKDEHMHFGDGNYPLQHYLNDYTAKNAYITIETGKGIELFGDLRKKDYEYLKSRQL